MELVDEGALDALLGANRLASHDDLSVVVGGHLMLADCTNARRKSHPILDLTHA